MKTWNSFLNSLERLCPNYLSFPMLCMMINFHACWKRGDEPSAVMKRVELAYHNNEMTEQQRRDYVELQEQTS